MTAYLLLMPGLPMLFQGQEFAASSPFLYFADHHPGLDRAVRRGRREFLQQFPSMAAPEIGKQLADPSDEESFRQSTLDPAERQVHTTAAALHRDLLALRRDDPVLSRKPAKVDGAVLAARAWLLRFFGEEGDRLLIVNLGADLTSRPAPEPLVAPIEGHRWDILWSSETPEYGGVGTPPLYRSGYLHIAAESALVLKPVKTDSDAGTTRRRRDG
jgi:maltooligosyltrehalose trehalohydrolase